VFHHFGYKATLLKHRLSGNYGAFRLSWLVFMAKYSAVLGAMESIESPAPKSG
jgi:hypothetical protein